MKRIILSLATTLFLTGLSAQAQNIIYGTGVGKNPVEAGTYQRDDHWNIVAVAASFTIPAGQSVSYDAYVPYSISPNFFGGQSPVYGANNGYTIGGETYYWISPNTNSDFAPFPSSWSFIAAQEFIITDADVYEFNFYGNGDNTMAFFIDGSITGVGTDNPSITGGTQIGTTQGGDLNRVYQYTGSTYLSAGTHIAYAVVVDTGFNTGALITNSTFNSVPEPTTTLLLLLGGATLLATRRRRSPSTLS